MRRGEFVMLPVDGRFDLVRLRAFAAEFDDISDEEGGVRYRAVEFVEWIEAEVGSEPPGSLAIPARLVATVGSMRQGEWPKVVALSDDGA